jgi:hypothetical protein
VEKLWDIVKDRICNRLFITGLCELEETVTQVLKNYWLDARRAPDLVGPTG